MNTELRLRITVVRPPPDVTIQLQRDRFELLPPSRVTAGELSFDFLVRIAPHSGDGPLNFLGAYTQGPRHARFVYVNSGVRAGQAGSRWDRRAKVPLLGITAGQIQLIQENPDLVLEARIEGTARDGGPMCASVPLLGAGWRATPQPIA